MLGSTKTLTLGTATMNKLLKITLCLGLLLATCTQSAFAGAFPVGGGYKCSGKNILKGRTQISYKTAKAQINKKLKPAVKKLDQLREANASEVEVDAQQTIVNDLSQILGRVALCSRGQLKSYEDPYWIQLQSYFWVGTYTLLPYNITHDLTLGFGNDQKVMDGFFAVARLSETPVGILGTLDWKAKIEGVTPTLTKVVTFKSIESELGDMTFTINQDGTFKIDIVNTPPGGLGLTHVVVTGQRTIDTMAGTADLRGAGDASVATINFNVKLDK